MTLVTDLYFYDLNLYFSENIGRLLKMLKTTTLKQQTYERVVFMICERIFRVSTLDIRTIEKMQECFYVIKHKYPCKKMYGYQKVIDFMSKVHEKRMERAISLIHDWVIEKIHNPNDAVGYKRRLNEYESLMIIIS